MKRRYYTILWNKRNHAASKMNHQQLHQRPVFIQRRWCCIYDGIGRESSIMSSFPENQAINSLLPVRPTESSIWQNTSRISQWKIHNLPSGWSKTACFFDDQAKNVTAWWEVLIHPPCSPDIVPSDVHLFWSLQNSLNGKNFNSLEDCRRHLEQFFAQKD